MPSTDVPDVPDDLAERIDRSFGRGPGPAPDPDALVARGRRARRRRRTTGGLAVAAVVVTGVALAQPMWSDAGRSPDVTTPGPASSAPPSTPTSAPPTPLSAPERERLRSLAADAVTFEGDGRVTLRRGARVVRSVANPFGETAPSWSRGLAVRFRGHEFWYAMSGPGDGSVGGSTKYLVGPDAGQAAFEQFVAAQAGGAEASVVGPDVWPDVTQVRPVRMRRDGSLVARSGFQVVAQRSGVDVGRGWANPGDETAAALVRADEGTAYFVLARRFEGKPAQLVTVPQAGNGDDLAAFLQEATDRYATASGR